MSLNIMPGFGKSGISRISFAASKSDKRSAPKLSGGGDNRGKVGGFQAGPTNQAAIDVGPREQISGVIRLHRSAILNSNSIGGWRIGGGCDCGANHAADTIGFIGGADLAGPDGPDGFVGKDHLGGDLSR